MRPVFILSIRALAFPLLTVFFTLSLAAQTQQKFDSIINMHVNTGFNGNVFYTKNDSVIFSGSYGFKDYDSKEKLTLSSVFELASNSKQFTAIATVQLVEKGLIDYDSKVADVLEDFIYKNITIEHLLRHQSGLPDSKAVLYNKKNWNRKKMATNDDVIKLLNSLKLSLEFTPGSKYDYNNTGYQVLASVIEKVSGMSYSDYLRQFLFTPSGMTTARVYEMDNYPDTFANNAIGHTYDKRQKKYRHVKYDKNHKHIHWMNGIVGDRGVYASVIDMAMWKRALRDNLLITAESMSRVTSTDSISRKYGFGFAIYQTQDKGKWVYHNGSWSGFKTSAIYLPDSDEYLVILSNNRYEQTYKKLEDDLYRLIKEAN